METEPTTCTGIEVIPSEDGPIKYACTGPCCTGRARAAVQKRYVEPGFTAAMVADIPSDEEW